ncbi:MAG: hydroxyethylthiazole kinase [Bacteroidota bacterium]|nr:hydroxyethylthiazole kinase [Bacteroidota bacterium]
MTRADSIWSDVEKIRANAPLVQNITNYVVMNNTANALLAIGASPAMVHSVDEVEEMVAFAGSLVVNIGTLSRHWIDGMEMAMVKAKELGKPIVFDPVAVGATQLRNEACETLIQKAAPAIIRGNGSEILALNKAASGGKGVDSTAAAEDAVGAAQAISKEFGSVVVISGQTDFIISGDQVAKVENGTPMMTRVTGMGCTATAICGAFAAINSDPFEAAINAMYVMGICGEQALAKSTGPGSFQVAFLDALYNLTLADIQVAL